MSPPVPLLDLARQYDQVRAEVLAAVGRVCASQHYILGAEVEAFEREMAEFCGAHDAVGCASGTDALWLALVAAGVQPGDQVLTSPFSFFASASAIVRAGARPVFADIDPRTCNLDLAQVEDSLRGGRRDKLRALLPVHLFGQCADLASFQKLAAELDLSIIEDAAQAVGARWDSREGEHQAYTNPANTSPGPATRNPTKGTPASSSGIAGSMGVCAAFSFYPTKNLSAYGDAGLVTTNNSEMAAHMRRLRNHGSPRRYLHEEFGSNSRLDALQAAILRVKLKYVEGWNQARLQRAAIYNRLFAEAGLTAPQSAISSQPSTISRQEIDPNPSEIGNRKSDLTSPITLPFTLPQAHHVFHQYVVRAHHRDELRDFLTARNIGTEIYYPLPLHLQPCFAYLGYSQGDFPEAERACKEVLALPMFPELTEDEQRRVVSSIADFYC